MDVTPAGRIARDRISLRSSIDGVVVAARHWRNKPEDPDRRRKFLQAAEQAVGRAIALGEACEATSGQEQQHDGTLP